MGGGPSLSPSTDSRTGSGHVIFGGLDIVSSHDLTREKDVEGSLHKIRFFGAASNELCGPERQLFKSAPLKAPFAVFRCLFESGGSAEHDFCARIGTLRVLILSARKLRQHC
jgi:hypothetical protein